MAYKCNVCGANEVDNPGETCELCAIGQDPYVSALSGGQRPQQQYAPPQNPQPQSAQPQHTQSQHTYSGSADNRGVSPGSRNYSNGSSYDGGGGAQFGGSGQSGGGAQFGSGSGQSGGRSRRVLLNNNPANTDPYGNDMTPASPAAPSQSVPSHSPRHASNVQVYQPGYVPVVNSPAQVSSNTQNNQSAAPASNQPLTTGIIKNISTDTVKKSFLGKWFRSFFSGIPFSIDDDVTSFQVFPDYSGSTVNASGNACDQVIVYGKVTAGTVSENNNVEVYGKRDSGNNIIAKTIRNMASGTIVAPSRVIPSVAVRIITLAIAGLIVCGIFAISGAFGSGAGAGAGDASSFGRYAGGIALIVVLIALGIVFLKSKRMTKWFFICLLAAIGVAIYLFFPGLLMQIFSAVVVIVVIYLLITLFVKR